MHDTISRFQTKVTNKKRTNTNDIAIMFIFCCGLLLSWNLPNITIKMHIKLQSFIICLLHGWCVCVCACAKECDYMCKCVSPLSVFKCVYLNSRFSSWKRNCSLHSDRIHFSFVRQSFQFFNCCYYYECTNTRSYLVGFRL